MVLEGFRGEVVERGEVDGGLAMRGCEGCWTYRCLHP